MGAARPSALTARRSALAGVVLLLAGALAGPALASSVEDAVPRSYRAAVTPSACVEPGGAARFTVTLTNTSTQQQLGSADVTLPSGLGLDARSAAPSVSVNPRGRSAPTVTVSGATLALRDLAAAPGATVSVAFTATPTGGVHTIGTVAKQANNFSGPPGNDLQRLGAASTVAVGPCQLAFLTQPADAQRDEPVPGAGGIPWPRVQLVDGAGQPLATASTTITMVLGRVPSTGTLAGTLSAATDAAGVATFSGLRIDTSDLGYTLEASAPGFGTVESDAFDVYDDRCPAGEACTATATDGDLLSATASGTAGADGGGLIVTAQALSLGTDGCVVPDGTTVSRLPSEVTLLGIGLTDKTVRLRVDKAYDQRQTNNGVSFYQVCAQPDEPTSSYSFFPDRYTGEVVGLGEWGFLPDCKDVAQQTVCVLSREKEEGYPIITVFWGSRMHLR
jgi:hypothetical protein